MCPDKTGERLIAIETEREDVNYAKILNGMEIKCNRYLDLIEIFRVSEENGRLQPLTHSHETHKFTHVYKKKSFVFTYTEKSTKQR